MQRRVFTYRAQRSLVDLVDVRLATRLERLGTHYSEGRTQKLAIFAHEHIGIQINQFGVYDRDGLGLLFRFLDPLRSTFRSGLALDVGANIGNHSLFFSRIFRQVHAFEPHPSSYYLLAFNARTAGNVVPHDFGLGAECATVCLYENPANMGAASMRQRHDEAFGSVDVQVQRLDDAGLDLTSLCFIKIDVEGFEANVLRGAKEILRTHQPIVVLEQRESEFNGRETPAILELRQLGYEFCWPEHRDQCFGVVRRRLRRAGNLLFGRPDNYDIVVGDIVPARSYSMLIAVPRHFREVLWGR